MKKWYLFYSADEHREKLQQLVAELEKMPSIKTKQIGRPVESEKLQQVVAEYAFPPAFAFVPWGHHVEIVSKCETIEEAYFYIERTISEGWSRSALQNSLKADLYHKCGRAVTNFSRHLPSEQSQLAQAITKDTYDFSFITLPPEYDDVSGKSRKIDMLFYHIHLRRYIVVELKVKSFAPEFVGKLNFYVNAVDELIKSPNESPTLGLLICRDKDDTEVQWAFKGVNTPLGVATYENIEIKEIQEYLPSTEQIRERIAVAEQEFLMNAREQTKAEGEDGNK